MCKVHYRRTIEGRDLSAPIRKQSNRQEWCKIDGCGRPHAAHGFCGGHQYRWKNGLDLNAPWAGETKECSADDCMEKPKAKGYCYRHYPRFVRGGEEAVNKPFEDRYQGPKRTGCDVPGCDLPHVSTGLCRRHVNWKLNYNLSFEDITALSGRPCAICGEDGVPHLDHDHECCPGGGYADKCGKCVRGVLCSHCNKALGLFGDDTSRLEMAVKYLISWQDNKSFDRDLG